MHRCAICTWISSLCILVIINYGNIAIPFVTYHSSSSFYDLIIDINFRDIAIRVAHPYPQKHLALASQLHMYSYYICILNYSSISTTLICEIK